MKSVDELIKMSDKQLDIYLRWEVRKLIRSVEDSTRRAQLNALQWNLRRRKEVYYKDNQIGYMMYIFTEMHKSLYQLKLKCEELGNVDT